MAKYTILVEEVNSQPLSVLTKGGQEFQPPNGMPSEVKINGKKFNVIYHTKIYSTSKESLLGVVLYAHRLIIIDPIQPLHMMRTTLYHEMCHVYLHEWQERNTTLNKLTGNQVEELCDMFGAAHYDAMLNNDVPSA